MANYLDSFSRNRTPGKTLPREFYTDKTLFEADLRRVFYESWLFAGHTCEIPAPGDFFVFEVGEEEVLIVRDKSGGIQAHFNVCRHRGSKLVTEPRGCARALICPYHQWVYGLDGRLTNARLMGEGFDTSRYRLRSVHVRELAGLLFVCLSPHGVPPDFEPALAAIGPQLQPNGLDRAKIIRRCHYEVRANWKLLVENNHECYHCAGTHPEFCLSNYDLGVHGDERRDEAYEARLEREYERWRSLGLSPEEASYPDGSPYRVSRLPLKEGYLTESLDGDLAAPLMGDLTQPDVGSLRFGFLPNFWGHANCDFAMTTRLAPVGPELTRVEVCFLVHEDAVEGVDYDPRRITEVWEATSEQDWTLCENNHAGVKSLAYEPGPYSKVVENLIETFIIWYLKRLRKTPQYGNDEGLDIPAGAWPDSKNLDLPNAV